MNGPLELNRASHAMMALALFLHVVGITVSAQSSDYDGEIRDLREKIAQVRKKHAEVEEETGRDKQSFHTADSLQQSTIQRLTEEKTTLQRSYDQTEIRLDSLQAEIDDIERRCRNLVISGKQFSRTMGKACDWVLAALNRLPPANLRTHIGALQFLKSEIKGKSVDNVEALERFWQIFFAVDDLAGSVDVYTAPSPVPAVSGEMFFIRLGIAWLGVVDEKGTTAFAWHADTTDTAGAWLPVEHPTEVAAMLKCARMYRGNAVPEIVGLPFDQPLAVEDANGEEVLK
jgi:hypothetical protein